MSVAVVIVTSSLNGRSRLIINDAMKHDDGTYMCVAENPAGQRRALAAVRVKGITLNYWVHFRVCQAKID